VSPAQKPTRTMSDIGPRRPSGAIRPVAMPQQMLPQEPTFTEPVVVKNTSLVAPSAPVSQPVAAKQTPQASAVMTKPAVAPRLMPVAAPVTPAQPRPPKAQMPSKPVPLDNSFVDVNRKKGRGSAAKTVLQFILGILIIAGVAAAVVMLYVKIYQ